ncbi:protein kinase [Simplicispira metamorpha]|uniref:Uncharacterized protein n=1 Tax=Simplicispira metamorpha TaxID=80881 RepID=A0A4V2SIT0_9BURK|nr:protein kinase [Simplicispira metamorpha]TCP10721.1 hypothetical protein EV674_1575 [Simplicispira metamorpha]
METYDTKSCNDLAKLHYRPIDAALRWCGLIAHEMKILQAAGESQYPPLGSFPQWPCLRTNIERIIDAIETGELPHGRDGKTVIPGDHVAVTRRTIRHSDLKAWMAKHHPDQKPKFLFDDIERTAHPAINADSFRALQADRDALKARIEKAEEWAKVAIAEKKEWIAERSELVARLGAAEPLSTRERNSLHRIIGGLLELVKNPRDGRSDDAAVIRELVENYSDKEGISARKLQEVFPVARRLLSAD